MSRAQAYYVGDPDGCVEWLARFVDAGVRHLVLRFATLDPLPHLDRLAEHVLPRLRLLSN